MEVYRLTTKKHADDISGTGAKLFGGRWNNKGETVLYSAASRALALIEVLVHLDNHDIPNEYIILTIYIPDDSIFTLPEKSLPENWNEIKPPDSLKNLSVEWLSKNEYLTMKVPSAVVQGDYNYLVNPLHKDFHLIKVLKKEPFKFDTRLF